MRDEIDEFLEKLDAKVKAEREKARLQKLVDDFSGDNKSTREAIDCVKGKSEKEEDVKKKDIKNESNKTLKGRFKNFGRKVKEIASTKTGKIAIKIGALATSILVAIPIGSALAKEVENYKAEVAERVLVTVKEELGAKYIYDKSTITGSNSGIICYEVVIDGETYRYKAEIIDGELRLIENDGLDAQTRGAIATAAHAQNGDVFDARKAEKLCDGIDSGDINLEIDER